MLMKAKYGFANSSAWTQVQGKYLTLAWLDDLVYYGSNGTEQKYVISDRTAYYEQNA